MASWRPPVLGLSRIWRPPVAMPAVIPEALRPGGAFAGAVPDEARRMADQINLHLAAGKVAHWAAIRLHDGGSDGIAYETRAAAIRHQLHEQFCTYVLMHPGGMTPAEAWAVLRFTRWAYDNGFRITSPEDPDPVMPGRMEDLNALLRTSRRF